jgi:DNA polymerase-3 subunit delta
VYKKEFDNLVLNQNKRFDAYMFYGQSSYLIEHYAAMVANLHADSPDEIEKIYFDEFDLNSIKDKLLQSSLFSSNNIVLVKTDKKLNKKDTTALIEACNTNPDSVIIFACMGDSDFKTMGGYFTNKTNSVSIRFFTPYESEAIFMLKQKAQELNLNIDHSALTHLYFMHNSDLSFCMSDMEKLSILNEQITSKTVDYHCFGMGAVSIEDFLNKLLQGQSIKKDLYLLLDEGINEIQLINRITDFVYQLMMIRSYMQINGTFNSRDVLGYSLPKNIETERVRLAQRYNIQKYLLMLEFLQDIELDLKSGKLNDINSFTQAILRKFSFINSFIY